MSLLSPSVLWDLVHFPHLDLTHVRLSTFLGGSVVHGLWPLKANSIIYVRKCTKYNAKEEDVSRKQL